VRVIKSSGSALGSSIRQMHAPSSACLGNSVAPTAQQTKNMCPSFLGPCKPSCKHPPCPCAQGQGPLQEHSNFGQRSHPSPVNQPGPPLGHKARRLKTEHIPVRQTACASQPLPPLPLLPALPVTLAQPWPGRAQMSSRSTPRTPGK